MSIGDRIKYYREQAGMTMEQLAQAIGVQNSAINKYEKGVVTNIPINRIRQIADALGINARLLLDFLDENSADRLTNEEKELLAIFRGLSKEGQAFILGSARGISGNPALAKKGSSIETA